MLLIIPDTVQYEGLIVNMYLIGTSAFGTCIQNYVIERYVCLIVFMVIAQTHVQAVASVH